MPAHGERLRNTFLASSSRNHDFRLSEEGKLSGILEPLLTSSCFNHGENRELEKYTHTLHTAHTQVHRHTHWCFVLLFSVAVLNNRGGPQCLWGFWKSEFYIKLCVQMDINTSLRRLSIAYIRRSKGSKTPHSGPRQKSTQSNMAVLYSNLPLISP